MKFTGSILGPTLMELSPVASSPLTVPTAVLSCFLFTIPKGPFHRSVVYFARATGGHRYTWKHKNDRTVSDFLASLYQPFFCPGPSCRCWPRERNFYRTFRMIRSQELFRTGTWSTHFVLPSEFHVPGKKFDRFNGESRKDDNREKKF